MQKEKSVALFRETEKPDARKRYRTVGLVMFLIASGLLVMRLLVSFIDLDGTALDVLFSVGMQVGVLLILPYLVYKFMLKMSFREIMGFSNVRKCKWYYLVLAIPLGVCVFAFTIIVSSLWQSLIAAFGYTHSSPGSDLPKTFNAGILILNVFLTGVLPGVCEEFANRGGFLTTVRASFPLITTVLIAAVEFGLFHQNITQVFYTMFFGALCAFLTLRLHSILPAMILHFVNNTVSVLDDFCSTYGWLGGGVGSAINWGMGKMPIIVILAFMVIFAVGVAIVFLMWYLSSSKRLEKKKEVIASSGYDHTNNRVVLLGEENPEMVRELNLDKEVYGHKLEEDLYKPTLRDNAFFIGAIVMAVATTVFTFIFGLII